MGSFIRWLYPFFPSSALRLAKQRRDQQLINRRHRAALEHLKNDAVRMSAVCLEDADSLSDWQRQSAEIKAKILDMFGLDRMTTQVATSPSVGGTIDRPAYRMEKLIFELLDGYWVTANYYLPHNRPGPLPCILYLNGHWPSLDGAKTGFQDRYLWYPSHGFALLVIDPIGFGEVPGVHPGTNRLRLWNWLSLGYTPASLEVWNAMRAIDWLTTRPEIDPTRIGVTGISGGGVMTQYLAALDDRVAVAAASCSTFTLGDQIARRLVRQQCDCTFFPNLDRIDFPAVLALVAPRPLLILGGRKDPIFPPSGFRAAYSKVREIFNFFPEGADRIRLVESNCGHTDPPRFLEETHRWMCRWLDVEMPIDSRKIPLSIEPPETLRCCGSPPRAALNYHPQDAWLSLAGFPKFQARPSPNPTPSVFLGGTGLKEVQVKSEEHKDLLLGILRTRIFGWFPARDTPFRTRQLHSSGDFAGEFTLYGEFEFESEPGVRVRADLLLPRKCLRPVPLLIWNRGPDDQVVFPDIDELFPILSTHAIVILTPRLSERPMKPVEHTDVERTASLLGLSLATMQTWDLIRAVGWAIHDRKVNTAQITVYSRGDACVAALYAAILEACIDHVVLRNPPISHLDGPPIPTILRYAEIQEIAGLLTPRTLTFIGHRDYPLTAQILDSASANPCIHYTNSLPEAILEAPRRVDRRPIR